MLTYRCIIKNSVDSGPYQNPKMSAGLPYYSLVREHEHTLLEDHDEDSNDSAFEQ